MKRAARLSGEAGERSRFRALLANTSMLVGGRTATGLLSLAYIALAARSLGIEAFGLLTLVNAYAQTIGSIAEFKSWQTVLQYGTVAYREGRREELHRVIRFSLLLDAIAGIGGTVVALAGAYFFAGALGWPPGIVTVGILYATSVLFMSSTTATGVLRLMDRFDLIAIQGAISSIVRLVGAIVAYALGAGLGWFLLVWYVSTLAAFVFMAISATDVFRRAGHAEGFFRGDVSSLPREVEGVWRFVWNINLSSTLGIVTTRIATLAVGGALGAQDAAIFRIARQVSDAAARPAKLLVPALYPELARLWAEGKAAELRRLCLKLSVSAGSVATVAFVVLAFFGQPLIVLIVGQQYASADTIMLWLFGAAIITVWGLPLEPLLVSTGRSTSALVVRAAVTIVYLVLLFPIMNRYGLDGVGWSAVGAAAFLFLLQLGVVLRPAHGKGEAPADG